LRVKRTRLVRLSLIINNKEHVIKILSKDQKSVLHKLHLKVKKHSVGDVCDDNDECTINDRLNYNCECEGINVVDSFDIVVTYDDVCYSNNAIISTTRENQNLEWYVNYIGKRVTESFELEINEPVEILATSIHENGCRLDVIKKEYPKREVQIISDFEYHCRDEIVTLKIPNQIKYDRIFWYNEFEELIDSNQTLIKVQREGQYIVYIISGDCYKLGKINLRPQRSASYKIVTDDNFLCSEEVQLNIEPSLNLEKDNTIVWRRIDTSDYSQGNINWEFLANDTNKVTIRGEGIYSAQINILNKKNDLDCLVYDQFQASHKSKTDLLIQNMTELGFRYQKFFLENKKEKKKYELNRSGLNDNCILKIEGLENELWLTTLDLKDTFILQEDLRKTLANRCQWKSCDKYYVALKNIDCKNYSKIKKWLRQFNLEDFPLVYFYYVEKTEGNRDMVYLFSVNDYDQIKEAINK